MSINKKSENASYDVDDEMMNKLSPTVLKGKCDELEKIINNCITIFNSLSVKIGQHLLSEFPKDFDLYTYNNIVQKVISKNAEEPISLFLVHIFNNSAYKKAIMESDESFFKGAQHEKLTSSDQDRIKAMFQFKKWWDELNDMSKNYIKEAFKKMVMICGTYLDTKCTYNKIKKHIC